MSYRFPRPLLIGLIQAHELTPPKRFAIRTSLALSTNEEGYALLETFEVTGDPMTDEGTYAAVEDLAARLDAQALMVSGLVDLERVKEIGERVRLVVLEL